MSSSVPSPATVLEVFDALAPAGTPLTTSEVAERFDCTDRTVYNRLDALAEEGALETKKVGARGRVWWRPVGARDNDGARRTPRSPKRPSGSCSRTCPDSISSWSRTTTRSLR